MRRKLNFEFFLLRRGGKEQSKGVRSLVSEEKRFILGERPTVSLI